MNFVEQLVVQAQVDLINAKDSIALENIKAKYLGKQGYITKQIKNLYKLTLEDRKVQGAIINAAKEQIKHTLILRRQAMENSKMQERLNAEMIDVTLPGRGHNKGGIHPIIRSWHRIEEIFHSIGFDVMIDGPEIETDWANFTALNSPEHHPARSMQDTFYIEGNDTEGKSLLLRTHTSSMQVRYARIHKPPIKVIVLGRTYRIDSDATHSPMFHQAEGLWIDKNISFADLKGIYLNFICAFFETNNLQMRFRPSYFPFTEPSAEIDINFRNNVLKNRWLEVSGAGQIHPTVIRNMGFDPEEYLGFAFGSGLERLTMLRYGINDLRLFYAGDLRFLKQFN